MEMEERLSNVE
jgi:hypothetical protein